MRLFDFIKTGSFSILVFCVCQPAYADINLHVDKAGSQIADETFVVAQLYHSQGSNRGQYQVYYDEFGRKVTLDHAGRVIAIEQPMRPRAGNIRGQMAYDQWGNVPEDPNYFPAAPEAPDYGNYNRPVERAALPPSGAASNPMIDNMQTSSTQPHSPNAPVAGGLVPNIQMPKGADARATFAAYQILLSRAGASPGVIDGKAGSNVDKAAASYREMTGKHLNPADISMIEAELAATGGPAFKQYTITNEDAAQNYVASIPSDYALKAQMSSMGYTSVEEMLAARFHVDKNYLKELNPGVDFRHPGTVITVPNVKRSIKTKVARIIADKARKQVRGYDENGRLIVAYPSTIGSSATPSPSGIVQVERIATNPNYTYNPKINFKQGNNDKVLVIPPGPNGPVGTVWIALSKPTYGIHGTPEPSRIGKTSSHGCVRLTNWDAEELAKLVKRGVTVEFTD